MTAGAVTAIDDLFRVENQGTQPVYAWLLEPGVPDDSRQHSFYAGSWFGDGDATAVSPGDGDDPSQGDLWREQPQRDAGVATAAVELGVGAYVDVGLVVEASGDSEGRAVLEDGQAISINANADESALPGALTPPVPGNEPVAAVASQLVSRD